MNRVGAVLVETYRIDRLIGEGGMGSVYEAAHVRLPKKFAVKFLNLSLLGNLEALLRFRREAEIVAALDHPNIVSLLDYNLTDDGVPYVVLEFLDGEHLGQRIERSKLSLGEMMRILVPVAQALDYAHQRDIVHRDLKPENIIIARGGEQVKVVDFGIAKIRGGIELTGHNTVLGTVPYMAPEQLMGGNVDGRCDQFALGSLVYEMLTGEMAFAGDNVPAAAARVVHHQPPPIEGLSSAVNAALARALAKKSEERFPSVEGFARAMVEAASQPSEPRVERRAVIVDDTAMPAVIVEEQPGLRPLSGEATAITGGAVRPLAAMPTAVRPAGDERLLSGEATALTMAGAVDEDPDDQVADPPEPSRRFERTDPDSKTSAPGFAAIDLGWEDATAQVGAFEMPMAAAATVITAAPAPPDDPTPKVMDAVVRAPESTDKFPKSDPAPAPSVPRARDDGSIALDATLIPGQMFAPPTEQEAPTDVSARAASLPADFARGADSAPSDGKRADNTRASGGAAALTDDAARSAAPTDGMRTTAVIEGTRDPIRTTAVIEGTRAPLTDGTRDSGRAPAIAAKGDVAPSRITVVPPPAHEATSQIAAPRAADTLRPTARAELRRHTGSSPATRSNGPTAWFLLFLAVVVSVVAGVWYVTRH